MGETALLILIARDDFTQFAQPQNRAGHSEAAHPILESQADGRECFLEEREVNDRELKREGQTACGPEPVVAKETVKGALLVRAGVEDVEELEEDESGEGHGASVRKAP